VEAFGQIVFTDLVLSWRLIYQKQGIQDVLCRLNYELSI